MAEQNPGGAGAVSSPSSIPKFWPFSAKVAVLLAPLLLVILLTAWGLSRNPLHFGAAPAGWVLLGIVVFSLIPILLLIVEGVVSSGGTIEIGAVKIAMTAAATSQTSVVVPRNAAQQPGVPLVDSGSAQILDALEKSKTSDVVVIDLEDGHAWWETRLLILTSGAVRLGRPAVIVFTAILEEKAGRFVGWGLPRQLRDTLLKSYPAYAQAFEAAMGLATAARLDMTADPGTGVKSVPVTIPPAKQFIVHPQPDSLNPFLEEQLLADALGPLETPPKEISANHLLDNFKSVLHTSSIDGTERDDDWFRSALRNDDEYLAITNSGQYVGLMTRWALYNALLLSLTG